MLAWIVKGESGQGALIAVLLLLALGALMIPPLLGLMQTGLKAGQVHESAMQEYYAADAGVEDGLWQIKNDQLSILFPPPDGYDEYAYSDYNPSYKWEYDPGEDINDKDVRVTIENVWVPQISPVPDPDTARLIAEGTEEEPPKLMVTGSVTGASEYQIKLIYYWDDEEDENGGNLKVETIGIWLPPGFNYEGNCSLANDPDTQPYSTPDVEDYCSGKAVVWHFASVPLKNFPGGTGKPMQRSFTFEFSPADGSPAAALSWIDTTGVTAIDYTWDADVKIYRISSVATDPTTGKQTTVEAYTAKIEVRKLGSAISGDYHAIGATLMTATGDERYRDRLYKESSATVAEGDIPSNATIEAAWLYWSGWIEGDDAVWSDSCDNFNDWIPGNNWSVQPPYGYGDKEFRGQGGGTIAYRTLTMHISSNPTHSLDLSPYSGQEVTISWEQREEQTGWGWPTPQLEPGDCLKYAFSGDGGGSWSEDFVAFCDDDPSSSFSLTIPDEYVTNNFKIRFFLDFDETNEYCYIDDISISVSAGSPVEDAKVNRVIFNGNQITTNQWQVKENVDQPGTWSYSCFYDATDIVTAELDPDTKSGVFTLGHVLEGEGYDLYPTGTTGYPLGTPALSTQTRYEWAYAGWSLVIIYSSPETKGHQLYLYDTFAYAAEDSNVDFDSSGSPGGSISGFLAPDEIKDEDYAARLTCFVGEGDDRYDGDYLAVNGSKLWDGTTSHSLNDVWNSKSVGLTASGIDIDTFTVEYPTIKPGDTSAQVDLPTETDSWNLVYIILSFRSEVTTGGAISYLIVG